MISQRLCSVKQLQLFDAAQSLADQIKNPLARDMAFALIAKNQIRALQRTQAERSYKKISSRSVGDDVLSDIKRTSRTIQAIDETL